MMWVVITIVSTIFAWVGTLIGGGWLGLWSSVLGVLGCFVGLWLWFKFMREM
jgi:hypothetical protein